MLRPVFVAGASALALLVGCSNLPQRDDFAAQANARGEIAFDVVKIDEAVVDVLAARPRPAFRERFEQYRPAPELPIAIGDVVWVVIWEASAKGLFGNSLMQMPFRSARAVGLDTHPEPPTEAADGRPGTSLPAQPVGPDGTITIPYAGRVIAAGRTPREVGRRAEALLGPIAIDPQVLVTVRRGAGSEVTVAGDAIAGARVPLSPGGTRLLDVIAAAGGATAPVDETFVRLSRDGVTAIVPLAVLVAEPAQNIFARPGDILILLRVPRSFSVFGAAGKNALINFETEHLSLAEALARAGGLLDRRADPSAVFIMRYEPAELVHALGQPVAARSAASLSPIVYRLDLADVNSYLLAKRFPVRDRDLIFVAEAKLVPVTRALQVLSQITGPVTSALLVCRSIDKC